jgi:Tfp pilus assembly protein PilX
MRQLASTPPVRDEAGIALVMALAFLIILGLTGFSLYAYTSANSRSASYSKSTDLATRLAETGVNEALSVLANPANNAFDSAGGMYPNQPFPSQASPRTSTYPSGTATWYGSFDSANATWTVTSTGAARNPIGAPGSKTRRTLSAQAKVTPPPPQTVQASAWDYLFAGGTGQTCDMLLSQSVNIVAPIYAVGNLCLTNTATVTAGPLTVGGVLSLSQNANSVGTSTTPVNAVHLGGGCQTPNGQVHNPCRGNPDKVYATTLDSTITPISFPIPNWDAWYRNASPGPRFPCQTQSGMPPTFESGDTVRNNSVPSAFNLTPAGSYTCKTLAGELSWDGATNVLTISGTVFIDGSVSIGTSGSYTGQGTIYTSGSVLMKNATFCAVPLPGNKCDNTNWDPNTRLLTFVANGNGDNGIPAGDSIQLKGATFQGSLYGTNAVDLDTTSSSQGPIVAWNMSLGQTANAKWPKITKAQAGLPGNTPVYSTITVSNYSG